MGGVPNPHEPERDTEQDEDSQRRASAGKSGQIRGRGFLQHRVPRQFETESEDPQE